ncbi:MAG TPA: ABC transporter ATP-binding protein, partial [Azospira sp.]|nr:ABC transporter ATP-binding protein [Azospira sp.]
VAQALVHKPPVIVLDEPTAGVDVELRQGLWQFVRRLNGEGHTIILTTHYLEEAEALCGRIAMLQKGRVVALDSTENLLREFSGHALTLRLAGGAALPESLVGLAVGQANGDWQLRLPDFSAVERVLASLREAGIAIEDMRLSPPDLEEAFVRVMQKGRTQ